MFLLLITTIPLPHKLDEAFLLLCYIGTREGAKKQLRHFLIVWITVTQSHHSDFLIVSCVLLCIGYARRYCN